MKEVTILFSSGAQIQFNAVEFSVSKNPVGGFKGFSWTDSALGPQIARIKPENVDNVVIEDFVYDRKNYPKVEKQSDWKRFVAGVNWKS
ncbi:hypothetical protein [Brevibacillus laterosporus]|uniref:hypothetical protein n=1 Tax=Brevibacillus laterosporus TaxID=1465 RepID=UPI003D22ED98